MYYRQSMLVYSSWLCSSLSHHISVGVTMLQSVNSEISCFKVKITTMVCSVQLKTKNNDETQTLEFSAQRLNPVPCAKAKAFEREVARLLAS